MSERARQGCGVQVEPTLGVAGRARNAPTIIASALGGEEGGAQPVGGGAAAVGCAGPARVQTQCEGEGSATSN